MALDDELALLRGRLASLRKQAERGGSQDAAWRKLKTNVATLRDALSAPSPTAADLQRGMRALGEIQTLAEHGSDAHAAWQEIYLVTQAIAALEGAQLRDRGNNIEKVLASLKEQGKADHRRGR